MFTYNLPFLSRFFFHRLDGMTENTLQNLMSNIHYNLKSLWEHEITTGERTQ